MPQIAPYGSWKSPITSDLIVAETIKLEQVVLDGSDIYWIERRPAEGGRYVIVRRTPDGTITDMLPAPYNARTTVHEYGGGSYTVSDGVIYFSNFSDQHLYRLTAGSVPKPIAFMDQMRYADYIIDQRHNRIICVREDHTRSGHEPVNTLVSIALDGSRNNRVLVSGNDFYASPRLSPDGSRLAWLTWNHPNMPWDGTELWIGKIAEDGSIIEAQHVAGSESESIFQPEWSPDGVLHFVSDKTDWWNLYRWQDGNIVALHPMEAEFGVPQWAFAYSTYAFASSDMLICSYFEEGIANLARLNITTGKFEVIDTFASRIEWVRATPEYAIYISSAPLEYSSVKKLDLDTLSIHVLRRSSKTRIETHYLTVPDLIEFPTEHGLTAYAFFYPPRNSDYEAPRGELPPLLVMSHGGPTGMAYSELDLETQYWTSRGIAVLDVNYGGSTGFGRAYRRRLEGQWGIVDVDDCVNGALYLVELGLVDGDRLAITGGSAGGYTTLCALTFRDVFKAGASHFGISDLEALEGEDHKFESRYNYRLVGPYPERRDLYRERSPINYVDRLSCPIIFFQGLEDKVVPPQQSELMVAALRAKKLPVAYIAFEGEQHGFRQAKNIKRALDGEFYFYSRVFHFTPADAIAPVHIENL
ncbi:MAG TPA: prolyl oligopeptidase family serine peptidase [Ktedonobacteraceae bacterium]|nr:prolyl oligopeptidase family serine peptidase [Ktedonobacteraceae bacterium]